MLCLIPFFLHGHTPCFQGRCCKAKWPVLQCIQQSPEPVYAASLNSPKLPSRKQSDITEVCTAVVPVQHPSTLPSSPPGSSLTSQRSDIDSTRNAGSIPARECRCYKGLHLSAGNCVLADPGLVLASQKGGIWGRRGREGGEKRAKE